jgi:hypothetical protein
VTWPVFSVTLPLPHFMKSAFYLILLYSGSSVFSFSWNLAQLRSKPSVTRPGNSRLFAGPGCEGRWVFPNGPAQASSRLETGNDGDGLSRPRSVGFGREDLHLRPVVRELAAAIKANHVCPDYGSCCSAAAQFAAHGDREAAAFVPTTEDQIEQTHKPSSIEATHQAASRNSARLQRREPDFGYLAAIFGPEQVALTAPASPDQPPPPSKDTTETIITSFLGLILKCSEG